MWGNKKDFIEFQPVMFIANDYVYFKNMASRGTSFTPLSWQILSLCYLTDCFYPCIEMLCSPSALFDTLELIRRHMLCTSEYYLYAFWFLVSLQAYEIHCKSVTILIRLKACVSFWKLCIHFAVYGSKTA